MEAVGKKVPRDIRKLIGQGDFIERGQGLRRLLKRRLYETSNALKKEGQAVPAQVQQMVDPEPGQGDAGQQLRGGGRLQAVGAVDGPSHRGGQPEPSHGGTVVYEGMCLVPVTSL